MRPLLIDAQAHEIALALFRRRDNATCNNFAYDMRLAGDVNADAREIERLAHNTRKPVVEISLVYGAKNERWRKRSPGSLP